jgi:RNA recognition motif-containing protein
MAGRPDVLKIFIGNLHHDCNKPKLVAMFEKLGMYPAEVIVPQCHAGKLAVAFVVFPTPAEAAAAAFALNGRADPDVAPGAINVHRGAIMGVFSTC